MEAQDQNCNSTANRYILRKLFQNNLYKANGQDFQNLFTSVMKFANPNFQLVKPHGKNGDRHNDGFDPSTGVYYQVYGPEAAKGNERKTIDKLTKDFYGVKAGWNHLCQIRQFNFVFNDKYSGIYPAVHEASVKLAQECGHPVSPFLAHHLEQVFMELHVDEMIEIVGLPPAHLTIDIVNYSVLGEVVKHLMKTRVPYGYSESYPDSEFYAKIRMNNLGPQVQSLLTTASYQTGNLEEYFLNNSDFAKDDLRHQFVKLYEDSKQVIPDGSSTEYGDRRFFEILKNASPRDEGQIEDAVLVLMSYYFEACDIFEPAEKGA